MKYMLKKISVIAFALLISFVSLEPVFLGAATDTDNVEVNLTVNEEITISDGANVTMAPNISISTDSSIGSTSWTVTTNATAGYTLAVKADTDPALQSASDSFADYTEATPGTPDAWSVDSGSYEFGFGAYGTDVAAAFDGGASTCGAAGTPDASLLFDGFETTDTTIATRNSTTPTTGVVTNFCLAAEQNGVFAPSGTYNATITGTATTL